jgi:hypothetical protein
VDTNNLYLPREKQIYDNVLLKNNEIVLMKIGKSSCKEMLLNIKKQPKEHFNAVHRKNIIINLQGKFFYYKLALVVRYAIIK